MFIVAAGVVKERARHRAFSPGGNIMKKALIVTILLAAMPHPCIAGDWLDHLNTEDLPEYLRDRGVGVPSSMFGTFIQKGQFIIYPYFEYYKDADFEYKPSELGYTADEDFRGDYEASEFLLFFGYGITDRIMVELEAAYIDAELEKGSEDDSDFPSGLSESGVGDIEAQLRWRWAEETATRPEVFSYFETVFPTQDEGALIGTTDWEFIFGTGVIRGFTFGTMACRIAAEYDGAEEKVEIGEIALEYLKRLSSSWRIYGAVEGTQDEWELITEAQWHLGRHAFVKLNNAFGLTSKAPDWAPEVGVLFAF
jgi:hypothetical protein